MHRSIAVLDFEATCEDRGTKSAWDPDLQEIIELPVSLVSVADRRVVSAFTTFVRPTVQPILTPFCTKLTSITQKQVDAAPPISEAIAALEAWLDEHDATDALVVTCGDWDLRTMWPRQVSNANGLATPAIFKRWCNLKHALKDALAVKAGGMMGMLAALGLTHEGVHHRGADDVKNICRIVIALLERGAVLAPTWSEDEQKQEWTAWQRKWSEAQAELRNKRSALEKLPSTVPADVRAQLEGTIQRLDRLVTACATQRDVFA